MDDDEYDALAGYAWRYYANGWTGYAVRVDDPAVKMHRLVAGAAAGMVVHHENGDGIDNRRANLRIMTISDHRRLPHPRPSGERARQAQEGERNA